MTSLVIANWKMHGSLAAVNQFARRWSDLDQLDNVQIVICPPFPYLASAVGTSDWQVGAQDCAPREQGAFTGDVSASMLRDLGCQWVILGHSERRIGHGETDALVATKAAAAMAAGLGVVVCVGESLTERESDRQRSVVTTQLQASLEGIPAQGLVVAYEPIWAIGTGKTATPDEADDMHRVIGAWLQEHYGTDGEQVPVIYGGSVKPENAAELFARDSIRGGLVGGASLDADDFWSIASAADAGRE